MRARFLLLLPLVVLAACGGEAPPDAADDAAAEAVTPPETTTDVTPEAPVAKLNVNTASGDAMEALPGVGERMAHEFEEYRPYVSIQQFRREIGKYVDEETVAGYEAYLYVPVNPNESDAATLQQIPGLDADEAQTLIDARPYASPDAFLEALGAYVSEDEATTAATYLTDEG